MSTRKQTPESTQSAAGCELGASPCSAFRCIVADPPWPYGNPRAIVGNGGRGSDGGRAAEIIQADVGQHYHTMSMADLKAMPVADLSEADAHLYLWTTNSFMVQAHELAAAWGYTPKTIITWDKVKKASKIFEPSMKTGWWYRSATEHCLFAVRGSMRLQCPEGLPTLLLDERLPHSVKPDSFMQMVEKASGGPYLELFARRKRPGWQSWGNEVESDICMPNK